MDSPKTLSHYALKNANSAYKSYNSHPIGGEKDAQDAERFHKLVESMTVSNALYTETLRIEHQCLKTAIESFQ